MLVTTIIIRIIQMSAVTDMPKPASARRQRRALQNDLFFLVTREKGAGAGVNVELCRMTFFFGDGRRRRRQRRALQNDLFFLVTREKARVLVLCFPLRCFALRCFALLCFALLCLVCVALLLLLLLLSFVFAFALLCVALLCVALEFDTAQGQS